VILFNIGTSSNFLFILISSDIIAHLAVIIKAQNRADHFKPYQS